MTPPRLQFTIKDLFWATFWIAAGMAAWTFTCGHIFDEHLSTAAGITLVIAGYFGLFAPLAGIGMLVGRSIKPSRIFLLAVLSSVVAYAIGITLAVIAGFPRT